MLVFIVFTVSCFAGCSGDGGAATDSSGDIGQDVADVPADVPGPDGGADVPADVPGPDAIADVPGPDAIADGLPEQSDDDTPHCDEATCPALTVQGACEALMSCWVTAGANPFEIQNLDAETCEMLLPYAAAAGQDPTPLYQCVSVAPDCAARQACVPITQLAAEAMPICSQVAPCWVAASLDPYGIGWDLCPATCAPVVSFLEAAKPGTFSPVLACVNAAADCSAKMACMPQ